MDSRLTDPILILGALVLVLLNGFFVAAEFALVKVRLCFTLDQALSGDERATGTPADTVPIDGDGKSEGPSAS